MSNPSQPNTARESTAGAASSRLVKRPDQRPTDQVVDADNASKAETDSVILPVVEERLSIKKEITERGRVVISVESDQKLEEADISLAEESVQVERVAVNRPVEAIAAPREEGDVTIIPVYEEVLIVQKQLMLKEEIRLTRKRTQKQQHVAETVRKERATVQRVQPPHESAG